MTHRASATFLTLTPRRGIRGDSGPDTIQGEAAIEPLEGERGNGPEAELTASRTRVLLYPPPA